MGEFSNLQLEICIFCRISVSLAEVLWNFIQNGQDFAEFTKLLFYRYCSLGGGCPFLQQERQTKEYEAEQEPGPAKLCREGGI